MSVACPFARLSVEDKSESPVSGLKTETHRKEIGRGSVEDEQAGDPLSVTRCPVAHNGEELASKDASVSPKCPLGYDSGSFKIGPLSCVICRALLFESTRCVPCGHIFCRGCISRFQDCVICGADIERIDSDPHLQELVERFIEGHARIKRPPLHANGGSSPKEESPNPNVVTYEDVSLVRGSFLLQHAMRAFQAQNLESAKSRLLLCADDTREELLKRGTGTEICAQLGAVLGMLGDCCRSMGDSEGATRHYQESVELLTGLQHKDDEVVHALSVSLNKLGDLKYYGEDLIAAHEFYIRALKLRQLSTDLTKLSSEVLDVAVSLAKVADVSRAMGNKAAASEGFQEAVKTLEGLSSPNVKNSSPLEIRRLSILEFLHKQLAEETV